MMNRSLYSVLAVIVVATLVASALAPLAAYAAPDNSSDVWRVKVHPMLLKKIEGLGEDDEVVVVIRLQGLPADLREAVRGDYHAAVTALKSWAQYSQAPIVSFIQSHGGVVLNTFWLDNVVLAKVPVWLVKALALDPRVVEIFENFQVRVLEPVSKEPITPSQEVWSWGIFQIRAPEVWAEGYTGEGVRIAVLDTGVDINHPALQGKMLTLDPNDPSYPGGWMEWDGNGNPVCSTPHDTHGHGTHTSGTALGGDTSEILIGVAPGATLMHGLVLPGGGGTFAQVLAGMQWTVEPYDCDGNPTGLPAHVVSMSWGADGYYGNELLPAIENMLLANIIPVAAIGNSGPYTSSNPGNIWGAFGIGATDQNDNVASWSSGEVVNWPDPPAEWPFFDTYPSTYIKPDFSAPGVAITSAVPGGGYEAWSGTSMATPHVSGTVALILQAMGVLDYSVPDLPELVYQILNATAIDFGDPGQDIRYGWGRIDAYEAVKLAEQFAKPTGVEGYVFDAVNSQPVPWATVTVVEVNKTVSVNDEGYFKIPLDPGNYTLVIEAWGYQAQTIQVEVVLLNGTIAGFVYDAFTGEPIPGAAVTVEELNLTVYTDVNGTFQVSVQPGTYTLTASAEGYQPESLVVSVGENETVLVSFALTPAGNGTVYGFVYDAETGDPIEGAIVWTYVDGQPVYNITGPDGYYELSLPAGVYTIYAAASGYSQAQADNVTLSPGEAVQVDFYLEPLPPAVVVLGNVRYYTEPHIAQVLIGAGIENVVEYSDVADLISDWQNGVINPVVVVVDHWKSDSGTPTLDEVQTLIALAELSGASLIFLGTSYSGTTGLDALYAYSDDLEGIGYPAPDDYDYAYPSPEYVLVYMLQPDHPIFTGVVPDGDDWFYLADVDNSYYADHKVYYFLDDDVDVLALVNDTYNDYSGVGVAEWVSYSGAYWYFLGSWGESYWMQYLEPGSDGVYSNNTQTVLVNAVLRGLGALGSPVPEEAIARALALLAPAAAKPGKGISPNVYTYVEVYLERQPYGIITGRVVGPSGEPIPGAVVTAVGTPMSAVTDANGEFSMWLPEGTYVLSVYAEGYYPAEFEVTVTAGETINLGDLELERQPRVAILFDYAASLKSVLEAAGYYAKDYTDIEQLTQDIATGFYDAVIYAGYYGVPFPTQDQFFAFLEAAEQAGVGIVWMDSWGNYGYGIKVLSYYTGDPASVGSSWGRGYVNILVEAPHPILEGYEVGQAVTIVEYTGADFSWFDGFSGQVIASTYVGGMVWGASIGVKMTEAGNKWVLLSSFAPTQWNDPSYFTLDAWQIIINAVHFASTKPLNVTLENPVLHVGDTAVVHVTGAPMGAYVYVYFDGEYVGRGVATGPEGAATITFTVPLVPGGEHLVEAQTKDGMYYGAATLLVVPKLTVSPKSFVTPALLDVSITGLAAYERFYFYLDANMLGMAAANELGAFSGKLNIPLVASGQHELKVVSEAGMVYFSVKVTAVNGLEELNASIVEAVAGQIAEVKGDLAEIIMEGNNQILAKLDEINASIVGVVADEAGELYALVNSTYGLLAAKLDSINASLAGLIVDSEGNLLAAINTAFGQVTASIDEVGASIEGLIADKTGELAVLITSSIGNVTAGLEEINASITGLIVDASGELYAAIQAGKSEILAKIDDSADAVIAVLQQVNASIASVVATESGKVYALVETAYGDILVKLDQLNASLAGLIVDSSGELKAVIETGLGEVMADLEAIDARIVNVSEDLSALIETSLGTITASLDELNASLAGIVVDQAGEVKALIETALGEVLASLDALNASLVGVVTDAKGELLAVIDTRFGEVTASLDELNASLAGLVASESGKILAKIDTALGEVTTSLDALNATITQLVVDSKGEVLAKIDTAYGDIMAKLDEIANQLPAMKSELQAQAEAAQSRANQAAAIGAAGTALGLAALALAFMVRRAAGI